jgi:hypothetical protein
VAKQKCGTCRFFEEAGLAGSGWCHHPQRKVSSDVMIMVRRSELACRDDWANRLWEPLQGGEQPDKPLVRPAILGPTTPASLENMRSLLQADTTVSGESLEGEDVLLSEGRIISEAHEPAPQPVQRSTNGGFDPRTAVMKAREAYRDRARARDAAVRSYGGAAAIAEPDPRSSRMTSRESFTSKMEAEEANPPPAVEESSSSIPAVAEARAEIVETVWEEDLAKHSARELTRIDEIETDRDWHFAADSPPEALSAARTEQEINPLQSRADTQPYVNGTAPPWYRTDLPRVCRTCRDYRPSSEGGRGWCANAWAFTHRRLVQEDDAAPCESSFGDWWAPVDDVWLVAADVSSHSRATPLLDRLATEERGQRRRS